MFEEYKKYEPIFGSWYIKKLIGEGSFGRVFEIQRQDFGTYRAALKVISIPHSEAEIEAAASEGMEGNNLKDYYRSQVDEIVNEFAIMSKLKGTANVVSYEDHLVVPHEDGIGWDILIRMELLTSLKEYMQSRIMTERDIIKMGADISRALELCQKNKIIHRDIKPDNIFISPNGDYKLGDFGIARTVDSTMSGLSKKGTFFYMAPEVYRGYAYGSSVDIYSLGMVMYFLLNNKRHPFMPPSPQPIKFKERENALASLMRGLPLPRPAHGSDRLCEIVCKACEYDPAKRFSSAREMKEQLEQLLVNDKQAASRLVLGADSAENIGQFMYEDESTQLPDGPGTAVLSAMESYDNSATLDVNSTDAMQMVNRINMAKRVDNMKNDINPKPEKEKSEKHDAGGRIVAGIVFALVVLLFVAFIISKVLPHSEEEPVPEFEQEQEEQIEPEEEDNNKPIEEPNKEEENPMAEKLILNVNVLTLEIGDSYELLVSASPENADIGDIKWSTSDESIVTVSDNGKITAVGSGIAGVTVTVNGLTATCTVNVTSPVAVTGIAIASMPDKTEYKVGESLSTDGMKIQISYSDGTSKTVDSGFSVDSEPFDTPGTVTITITYSGFIASFNVTVTENTAE